MPAAWPVLSLGTMVNQQNTPDVQASAPLSWARRPSAYSSLFLYPQHQVPSLHEIGEDCRAPREACHRGASRNQVVCCRVADLGLRTCQKVRVAKRNRGSRNSPSGEGSLLQVILGHLEEVHLLGPQVPRSPAWPTYLIKDCPCNAYKKKKNVAVVSRRLF